MSKKPNIVIRLIAAILLVAFSFENILWANPEVLRENTSSNTLQVQSPVKPIVKAELQYEFFIKFMLRGIVEFIHHGDDPNHAYEARIDDSKMEMFNSRLTPAYEGMRLFYDFGENDKYREAENWVIPCGISDKNFNREYEAVITSDKSIFLRKPGKEELSEPASEAEPSTPQDSTGSGEVKPNLPEVLPQSVPQAEGAAKRPHRGNVSPAVTESMDVEVIPDESYSVLMTRNVFDEENPLLAEAIAGRKAFFVVDKGIGRNQIRALRDYIEANNIDADIKKNILTIRGGESVKNGFLGLFYTLWTAFRARRSGLDRKSVFVAIGGGATIDMAGFAATIFHRGSEQIRIPTTLLAQDDAGIGVKNGINFFRQKNFLGTFQPPQIVLIDPFLLKTAGRALISDGLAEIIKVTLLKDADGFEFVEKNYKDLLYLPELLRREKDFGPKTEAGKALKRTEEMIFISVKNHLGQIKTDPYEKNLARPLDYGHEWGHRLEILTRSRLSHGRGVAIGMAIDSYISWKRGYITEEEFTRILRLITNAGLPVFDRAARFEALWKGLEHFRQHLGGELTISLLGEEGAAPGAPGIGKKQDICQVGKRELKDALAFLKSYKEDDAQQVKDIERLCDKEFRPESPRKDFNEVGRFVPTPTLDALTILEYIRSLNPNARICDLGSGNGKFCFLAARQFHLVTGIELRKVLDNTAHHIQGVLSSSIPEAGNVDFVHGDFFEKDLSGHDVLYFFYTLPGRYEKMANFNKALREKLLSPTGLKPGGKFIVLFGGIISDDEELSHEFVEIGTTTFSVYTRPAEPAAAAGQTGPSDAPRLDKRRGNRYLKTPSEDPDEKERVKKRRHSRRKKTPAVVLPDWDKKKWLRYFETSIMKKAYHRASFPSFRHLVAGVSDLFTKRELIAFIIESKMAGKIRAMLTTNSRIPLSEDDGRWLIDYLKSRLEPGTSPTTKNLAEASNGLFANFQIQGIVKRRKVSGVEIVKESRGTRLPWRKSPKKVPVNIDPDRKLEESLQLRNRYRANSKRIREMRQRFEELERKKDPTDEEHDELLDLKAALIMTDQSANSIAEEIKHEVNILNADMQGAVEDLLKQPAFSDLVLAKLEDLANDCKNCRTVLELVEQILEEPAASAGREKDLKEIRERYNKLFANRNFAEGSFISEIFRNKKARAALCDELGAGNNGKSLLSIGMGSGPLGEELAEKYGLNITGVDISPALVDRARGKGLNAILVEDGQDLSAEFDDESFDIILLSESIGYMDLDKVLAEAHRLLKPGGAVHITSYASSRYLDTGVSHSVYGVGDILSSMGKIGFRKSEEVPLPQSEVIFYVRGTKPPAVAEGVAAEGNVSLVGTQEVDEEAITTGGSSIIPEFYLRAMESGTEIAISEENSQGKDYKFINGVIQKLCKAGGRRLGKPNITIEELVCNYIERSTEAHRMFQDNQLDMIKELMRLQGFVEAICYLIEFKSLLTVNPEEVTRGSFRALRSLHLFDDKITGELLYDLMDAYLWFTDVRPAGINASADEMFGGKKCYDDYWHWVAALSINGGKKAIDMLSKELQEVGNEIFHADKGRDYNNHWSVAFQEICLEAIFLARTYNKTDEKAKIQALEKALKLKSSHVLGPAEALRNRAILSGERRSIQDYVIQLMYRNERISNDDGDYTRPILVDKIPLLSEVLQPAAPDAGQTAKSRNAPDLNDGPGTRYLKTPSEDPDKQADRYRSRMRQPSAADEDVKAAAGELRSYFRDLTNDKELTLDMVDKILSIILSGKELVAIFDGEMGLYQEVSPLGVIEELIRLKKDDRFKKLLEKLIILKRRPDRINEERLKYRDKENTALFVFARETEIVRARLKAVGSDPKVNMFYINENGFPRRAEYPLLEMVTIALTKYHHSLDGDAILQNLDVLHIKLEDMNIASIRIDKTGATIFTLLPNAIEFDKQALIRIYAYRNRLLEAA